MDISENIQITNKIWKLYSSQKIGDTVAVTGEYICNLWVLLNEADYVR